MKWGRHLEGKGKSRLSESSKTTEAGLKTSSLATNSLIITYTNVDSCTNKLQELKTVLNNTFHKPKIIALTEVKHTRRPASADRTARRQF